MARIILLTLALALAGCATVEGLGDDISAGARKTRAIL